MDRAGWWLLAIVVLALAVRLVVAVRFASVRGFDGGDQSDYLLLAQNLLDGQGYRTTGGPTAWRTPGYPLVLAAVLRVAQALPWDLPVRGVAGVAQATIGAGTVALTGLLGRRIARPAVGLVGAALLAVWPSVVVLTAVMLNETLFSLLLLAGVLVAFWHPLPSVRLGLAAGGLLGSAVLVRPAALPVALSLALWLAIVGGGRRRVAAVLAGVAIVMAPWVVRNAVVFDALIVTDTHGGYALCQSNRPGAGPADPDDPYCRFQGATEVENDRRHRDRALEWMVSHPADGARLVVERMAVMAGNDGYIVSELADRDRPDPRFPPMLEYDLTRLADGFWRVAAPLGALGVGLLLVRRRSRPATLVLLSVMVLPLFVTVTPRLHQPIIPLLALGVGAGIDALWRRGRSWATSRRPSNPEGARTGPEVESRSDAVGCGRVESPS